LEKIRRKLEAELAEVHQQLEEAKQMVRKFQLFINFKPSMIDNYFQLMFIL